MITIFKLCIYTEYGTPNRYIVHQRRPPIWRGRSQGLGGTHDDTRVTHSRLGSLFVPCGHGHAISVASVVHACMWWRSMSVRWSGFRRGSYQSLLSLPIGKYLGVGRSQELKYICVWIMWDFVCLIVLRKKVLVLRDSSGWKKNPMKYAAEVLKISTILDHLNQTTHGLLQFLVLFRVWYTSLGSQTLPNSKCSQEPPRIELWILKLGELTETYAIFEIIIIICCYTDEANHMWKQKGTTTSTNHVGS
jgi:hypothetical protein